MRPSPVLYARFQEPEYKDDDDRPSQEELKAWEGKIKDELMAFVRARYAQTRFANIGDLDMESFNDTLSDALDSATADVWRALE